MRICSTIIFGAFLPSTWKRVVGLMVCLIALAGQAAMPAKVDSNGVLLMTQKTGDNAKVVVDPPSGSSDKLPQAPSPTKQPVQEIKFKPVTYVLLTLSALIGPLIIFLLFRKKPR